MIMPVSQGSDRHIVPPRTGRTGSSEAVQEDLRKLLNLVILSDRNVYLTVVI